MSRTRKWIGAALLAAGVLAAPYGTRLTAQEPTDSQIFEELLARSLKEKRGLTFYVEGQTIPGVVVKVHGDKFVEVRNQTHSAVWIRLESIDAVAVN